VWLVTICGVQKFTTLLHNGNRVDKWVLYDASMHNENSEMEIWMTDWSVNETNAVGTHKKEKLDPFLLSQRAILLKLREEIMDVAAKVATSSRSSDNEKLPLKTHQADAATETYDCEFALGLLSHEKNAMYEIDEALRRIEVGTYGICELSGKPIPRERLKAVPFARFTVEVQSRVEEQWKALALSQAVRPHLTLIENEEEPENDMEL
jgi:RNA polymerase-binding transcription factor DksA